MPILEIKPSIKLNRKEISSHQIRDIKVAKYLKLPNSNLVT